MAGTKTIPRLMPKPHHMDISSQFDADPAERLAFHSEFLQGIYILVVSGGRSGG
jgi:hypothetical protein